MGEQSEAEQHLMVDRAERQAEQVAKREIAHRRREKQKVKKAKQKVKKGEAAQEIEQNAEPDAGHIATNEAKEAKAANEIKAANKVKAANEAKEAKAANEIK